MLGGTSIAAGTRAYQSCGGTLRKRVYPVGIAFKSFGFYVNDYAPKSAPAPEAKAEPKSEAKSEGGGTTEAKSESKPDAPKAEAKNESKPSAPAAPATT